MSRRFALNLYCSFGGCQKSYWTKESLLLHEATHSLPAEGGVVSMEVDAPPPSQVSELATKAPRKPMTAAQLRELKKGLNFPDLVHQLKGVEPVDQLEEISIPPIMFTPPIVSPSPTLSVSPDEEVTVIEPALSGVLDPFISPSPSPQEVEESDSLPAAVISSSSIASSAHSSGSSGKRPKQLESDPPTIDSSESSDDSVVRFDRSKLFPYEKFGIIIVESVQPDGMTKESIFCKPCGRDVGDRGFTTVKEHLLGHPKSEAAIRGMSPTKRKKYAETCARMFCDEYSKILAMDNLEFKDKFPLGIPSFVASMKAYCSNLWKEQTNGVRFLTKRDAVEYVPPAHWDRLLNSLESDETRAKHGLVESLDPTTQTVFTSSATLKTGCVGRAKLTKE